MQANSADSRFPQKRTSACDQKRTGLRDQKGTGGLEDWAMEQDEGFGRWVRGVPEVVDVAVGSQAADDGGAGRGRPSLALDLDTVFCREGKQEGAHKSFNPRRKERNSHHPLLAGHAWALFSDQLSDAPRARTGI